LMFSFAWALSETKLVASDGSAGDEFGIALALDTDTVAVGAIWVDDIASSSGAVYVYERTSGGWAQTAKVKHNNPQTSDKLGRAVAIRNGLLAVGDYRLDGVGFDSGGLFIFEKSGNTWQQTHLCIPADNAPYDAIGRSLAMDGDLIVVGGFPDDLGLDAGGAYVYERSGSDWIERQKLLPSDGAAEDYFAQHLAISGTTIVIGSFLNDATGGVNSGAAYVYERTGAGATWVQTAKLEASDAAPDDRFGEWVAIQDGLIAVGAFLDDGPAGIDTGSVYLFEKVGGIWTQTAKLTASDAKESDYFGMSVSIDGGLMVIGAMGCDDGALDGGAAYLFRRASDGVWRQAAKIVPSDANPNARFGNATAILGNLIAIGAEWDNQNGAHSGAVYLYEIPTASAPSWILYE